MHATITQLPKSDNLYQNCIESEGILRYILLYIFPIMDADDLLGDLFDASPEPQKSATQPRIVGGGPDEATTQQLIEELVAVSAPT